MILVITPRAAWDMEEIREHIALDDEVAAENVVRRFIEAGRMLAGRPEAGRPAPDSKRREWSVPGLPYEMPYRIYRDRIVILRVFHTSRLKPAEWS